MGANHTNPIVYTISARCETVYAGGAFTGAFNEGGDFVKAASIAQATWSENRQQWAWSDMDIGVYYWQYLHYDNLLIPAKVLMTAIHEGEIPGSYDLIVGGSLQGGNIYEQLVGAATNNFPAVSRWRVGYPMPTSVPVVTITNPISFTVFSNIPSSIVVEGKAASSYTNIISLDLYTNGVLVQALSFSPPVLLTNFVFDPIAFPKGQHNLKIIATDETGLKGQSRIVYFSVRDTNSPISAVGDQFTILMDSGTANLNVLANDLPPTGLRVSQIDDTGTTVAQIKPGHDGSYVSYLPPANLYGQDSFHYTVTNSNNDVDTATVSVTIRAKPGIWLSTPTSGNRFRTNTTVTVTGAAWDWDGKATNVIFYVNGNPQATVIPGAAGPITMQSDTNNPAGVLTATARPNTNFTFNWSSSTNGFYTLTAATVCDHGITNASSPITIVLTNTVVSPNPPTAHISNLAATTDALGSTNPPVIRDGLFNLQGQAADIDDTVSYQVLLYRPEDWESVGDLSDLIPQGFEPFADITPGPKNSQGFHIGGDVSGNLGTNDLTAVPNGIYDLVLRVRGGTDEVLDIVRVQIESNLKIGQFSFSEQDLVLPVNGIPLTVTRTYNSMNERAADFGYSWSYALNSMDVEIDEQRTTVTALDTLEEVDLPAVNPLNFSVRVGGGRNVTLTLPDGRRTTFQCTFVPSAYNDGSGWGYDAKWIAPPGVTATLTTPSPANSSGYGDNTVFAQWPPGKPFWKKTSNFTPMDSYDIPEYVLTTEDGTQYQITRDEEGETQPTYIYQDNDLWFGDKPQNYYIKPHPGKPKLKWIFQRSGDKIHITDTGVEHYAPGANTPDRSMFMQRDAAGRVKAIFDPNSGVTNDASAANAQALVKYIYNQDTGNLIQVQRLQDRNAGTYLTTKYHYDHPQFPHYITSIEDPRGIPLARNEYDDSGKLIAVVDADGKRTAFIHNTTNRVEIVTDRLGNTNSFVYDLRGNVTATTNALGQITTMAYDDFNNKTNEVVFLNGQPYATNKYVFINTNLLQASINALGYSNTFVYGPRGRLEISTDARGFSTTNYYDTNTDLLIATSDALGNVTSNYYVGGLLTGARDALGTVTTNFYDGSGNLTGTALIEASAKILSTNSYAYDANGNQTNSVTWRRDSSGAWVGSTNTTVYDAQNRVQKTIAPDGGETLTVYNALGKQDYTVDALNHTNRFAYDTQGRMWQTTYADGTTCTSYFDAEGRRTNSVDQAQRPTVYYYDQLGRITNTVYADNSTGGRSYYDGLGRVQFSVDARGVTNAFGYDILGRRSAVTNAYLTSVAVTNFFGYDADGNQPYVTNALGVVTTNILDALNRVTQVQFADGTKTSAGYDAVGRRVAETNQDNIVTRFGYDGAGRLIAVTNAFGISGQQTVTRYEFDEAGNQTAQIDALNRTNRYAYDNLGRRTKRTLPGNQNETFGYDVLGNLMAHTNFNGAIITNQYNVMNRLWKRWSGSTELEAYLYSATGRLTNRTDASGMHTWVYDLRDRLRTNTTPVGALYYTYDANGNQLSLNSDTVNGVDLTYEYDALNRLTNAVDNRLTGTKNTGYTFDRLGNLATLKYPNGVTNLWQYDSPNRLTNLTWKLNGNPRGDFTYKLGAAGHRTNLSETVDTVSRVFTWQYDKLYRLTNETVTGTAPTGNLGYGYDPVGNRTNRTGALGTLGSQTLNYSTNDWVDNDTNPGNGSTYFDANGNTTNLDGTWQYDWANRLTNFNNGTATYVYDAAGNRIKKAAGGVTTWYLVATVNPSSWPQVVEEHTGSSPGTLARRYTYGLDLISQSRWTGSVWDTHFYLTDGLGSTRALLNTSGNISDTYVYDAFGNLVASSGSTPNDYRYTGEQWDSTIGLTYLRARYLNPAIGRFQTMDSYEGNTSDPLSLHKYLYCHADPANGLDPSGQMDLIKLQATLTTWGSLAVFTAYRLAPVMNRATVIMYEMSTGSISIASEGYAVGSKATMSAIEGGLGTWANAVGKLKGVLIGSKAYLSEVLKGTGRQANHLNQSGAYTLIEKEGAACVDLIGNALKNGTEHNQFHQVLEAFWNQYRSGGSKFNTQVSNKGYLEAMRNALGSIKDAVTGVPRFTKEHIDALVELAEKEQRYYKYFDEAGGLRPDVPSSMYLTP